jgi:hypothetical protein
VAQRHTIWHQSIWFRTFTASRGILDCPPWHLQYGNGSGRGSSSSNMNGAPGCSIKRGIAATAPPRSRQHLDRARRLRYIVPVAVTLTPLASSCGWQ